LYIQNQRLFRKDAKMKRELKQELFVRHEGNPILTPNNWPYSAAAVFNPGVIKLKDKFLLLVRVKDRRGYSHLTKAVSANGITDWKIDAKPTLEASLEKGEAVYGIEDPRITLLRGKYFIVYTSFFSGVTREPPGISFATTKNFSQFHRLGQRLIPPDKDAALFPQTFRYGYALLHRPVVDGRADVWVSFSKDPKLEYWGKHRVLIPARHRMWDETAVGLCCTPIRTEKGWLIIYHGVRVTGSGRLYRIGLALLNLETLDLIRRSQEWVFGPREIYERVGDVDDIVFSCGAVLNEGTIYLYYGAADSTTCLATADLEEVLESLMKCPEK
jgi:predicted GH43/DUF377 family glycosyl hydrolase